MKDNNTMRIIAFGDTHTQHHDVKLPKGDVLIFAGDAEFRSILDLIDFNNWLADLEYEYVIVIAGNHDLFCERSPNEVEKYLTNAIYLKDEQYVLPNGMSLWGTPMTKTFLNWAFMDSEDNLERYYWSKIPKDTDMLLTHGPAYKHLDIANLESGNLGSRTLSKRIEELGIPYVICGHIHGGYGIEKADKTTYINCSVLNEDYRLVNKPIVIEL